MFYLLNDCPYRTAWKEHYPRHGMRIAGLAPLLYVQEISLNEKIYASLSPLMIVFTFVQRSNAISKCFSKFNNLYGDKFTNAFDAAEIAESISFGAITLMPLSIIGCHSR
jgi:hypothetical protein